MRRSLAVALALAALCAQAQDLVGFSEDEKARILSHGPWPPNARHDPTNRVSGKPEAIALGERLFFEPRLSGTGSVLCATCHAPFRAFQDGRARAFGLEEVERNTPSLINVGQYRWYGWDGAHDSLWSQSVRPMLDPREMRATPAQVATVMRTRYARDYARAFGRSVPQDDEETLVDVGKALAAYQETLVSGRTPFDDFRDALERGDALAAARYPTAAQRGLALFVGKANCSACHAGPHFSNGEFAHSGLPPATGTAPADSGRLGGVRRLKASPYNLLSRFNDDRSKASAAITREAEPQERSIGEFRVPGLRNVALTAPYMHDGSVASLRDAVSHHAKPALSTREREDLVVFLRSLTETSQLR